MPGRFQRSPDVVRREIAGEVILVPVRGKVADLQNLYVLNPVADCIWEHLDGDRTPGDITAAVVERFEVAWDEAASDVDEFVDRLREAGLVECLP